MRLFFLLLFLLLNCSSFAAFPILKDKPANTISIERASAHPYYSLHTHSAIPYGGYRGYNPEARGFGIAAVICSGLALLTCVLGVFVVLGAIALPQPGWLILIIAVLSTLGIVFGAKGIRRRLKGLSIAGMVLGIVEISTMALTGFMALLMGAFSPRD